MADGPRRSLVEEALEEEAKRQQMVHERFQIKVGEINPLRPPGYTGPSYGTPTWVYVAACLGILALLAFIGIFAF